MSNHGNSATPLLYVSAKHDDGCGVCGTCVSQVVDVLRRDLSLGEAMSRQHYRAGLRAGFVFGAVVSAAFCLISLLVAQW